jgi:hypothetical protein
MVEGLLTEEDISGAGLGASAALAAARFSLIRDPRTPKERRDLGGLVTVFSFFGVRGLVSSLAAGATGVVWV